MADEGGREEKWLQALVTTFEGIRDELEEKGEIDLENYVDALVKIIEVFDFLGSVFKFAKSDLVDKTGHLKRCCSERGATSVKSAVESDHAAGRALAGTSVSRPLHRVTNSLKFLNLLLKDMLREDNRDDHLRVSARRAFKGSIEYYLPWAVKKAVEAGLYLLPSRTNFLKRIGETEDSARDPAQRLVKVTDPILDRVYRVYKTLGIDL